MMWIRSVDPGDGVRGSFIHGCVGVTPSGLIEMFTKMFLIYGMLVVRKVTGNAWGCVAVFFVYWNAINKYYPVLFK